MKERIAEILYKIGLKRIAFKISPKIYWRLTFQKFVEGIQNATESFNTLVMALNEAMNKTEK